MKLPVTEIGDIFISMSEESLMNDHYSASRWAEILLSTGEGHIELIPWDRLGSDI